LHMAQLMPLPPTVSCSSKIQIDFTFLAPAHLGSPDKGPLSGCMYMVRHDIRRHNHAVESGLVVGFCAQPHYCYRPYYLTARFRSPSSYMVSDQPFPSGQGPCPANLHKRGLAQSPSCNYGQRQTMNHIVDTCPLTKYYAGLNLLHEVDDDAVIWLESTATAALAK